MKEAFRKRHETPSVQERLAETRKTMVANKLFEMRLGRLLMYVTQRPVREAAITQAHMRTTPAVANKRETQKTY
jgi:hypothetical protein